MWGNFYALVGHTGLHSLPLPQETSTSQKHHFELTRVDLSHYFLTFCTKVVSYDSVMCEVAELFSGHSQSLLWNDYVLDFMPPLSMGVAETPQLSKY